MKKFLNLELKKSVPDIPAALDKKILAAAKMRANGFKRREQILRILLPASTGVAAAAAAALFLIHGANNQELPSAPAVIPAPQSVATAETVQEKVVPVQVVSPSPVKKPVVTMVAAAEPAAQSENNGDMLDLSDMTSLEQGNYAFMLASESVFDEDIMFVSRN